MTPDAFRELALRFEPEQRQMLGAFACERRLPPRVFDGWLVGAASRAWLRECVERGVLVDAGVVHSMSSTPTRTDERALAIAPGLRAPILRELGDRDELDGVARRVRAAVGDRSLAPSISAFYGGDLGAVERVPYELKRVLAVAEEPGVADRLLREALCEPFDSRWLERVWGEYAVLLAERVLADALRTLEPVTPLYRWFLEHFALGGDTQKEQRSGALTPVPRQARLVCEHALLRGDLDVAARAASFLRSSEQRATNAARAYVAGDLAAARRELDALEGEKRAIAEAASSSAPSVIAVLALLELGRAPSTGRGAANRWLGRHGAEAVPLRGWSASSLQPAIARAIRMASRRAQQPENERARLSVHQLAPDTSVWELLITAVAVHLQDRDPITRAGWARRLLTEAARVRSSGFSWIAEQALGAARALDASSVQGACEMNAELSGVLLLVDLLEPEPEWRRALNALDEFVRTSERSREAVSFRVAWFVDMATGTLARPALEEFRPGSGWTRGERVELERLSEHVEHLPPEDAAIVRALDPSATAEERADTALELLCGHPRVFNGARGRLPVDVVRGTCRVETRREHGHLLVDVVPAGAEPGLNVVVDGETRLFVYRLSPALAKLVRLLPAGMRVPEQHEQEVLPLLARLAEHVEVRSAELGARRTRSGDSTPCLRLSPESGAWWVELGVRPFGPEGRFFPPGLGRMHLTTHAGSELVDVQRDAEEERARFRALLERCPTLLAARASEERDDSEVEAEERQFSVALGEEDLFAMLVELRDSGQAHTLEWQHSRPVRAKGEVSTKTLHSSLRRTKGWYLVTGGVQLDEHTHVPLDELADLPFTKSGRFLRLPTGDFLEVEQRLRRVVQSLRNAQPTPTGRGLRIPEAALDQLAPLTEAGTGLDVDTSAAAWLSEVQAVLATEPAPPAELRAELRPYQLAGYRWLSRCSALGFGACLADDMGLGKTVQVLALLLERRAGGPALVVAPTSVCTNWLDEIARFAPTLRAAEYGGGQREALLDALRNGKSDVLIVSYALLQQDAAALTGIEWNTAVLDEAQFIKNAHSLRARAAFQLTARQRIALTGTPVENHLGDLWSIFHFVNPALLGSWKYFQLGYLRPIQRDRDSDRQTALKKLLEPWVLRRTKNEVLGDLPPVTTVCHEVRLTEREARAYALLRRQIHEKLRTAHGKRDHKLQIFSEITRLRRFCCHPRLVLPEASLESSKLDTFLELAEELRENGHRALVFSQFVDFLAIVREQLDERGLSYVYLDGSTPKEQRAARVREFQEGASGLFVISLKAGGFGLNLTAADYVIHLDPWWNPAVEAQATDRAHRIGQTRPVTVYRLVTRETIEERIVELHREKRALAEAVLTSGDGALDVSAEQLLELLGPVRETPLEW